MERNRGEFILSDGSVDVQAAMAAGRRARAEAAHAGALGLVRYVRGTPNPKRGTGRFR